VISVSLPSCHLPLAPNPNNPRPKHAEHNALWGAHNARVTLLARFTTCRDRGPTRPYVDVDLRQAIDEGAVPGPRLLVAGNYVSSSGGAGDARQFSIYVGVPIVQNLADGPEEITKAVRTNFNHGADFIKKLYLKKG